MIQIDIDMPKQCRECPLCVDYDCIIHKRVTDEYYDTLEEQYAHCPLTMPSAQLLTAYVISDEDGNIKCSNCGSFECWGNYCMNCGAKMGR